MTHQRTSKKIFIYIFFFVTLVTISKKNLSSDIFRIKNLNIIGLNYISLNEIKEDLKFIENKNIHLLEKKNIIEKIYSNKIVEKFKVLKKYPSTLNIEIQETKFIAITKKNNIDYLVGTNGNLINLENTTYDLPYIFGNIEIKNFLDFKKKIEKSNFQYQDIKNLYYYKSNRWDLMTKDGLILKMPNNIDIQKLDEIFKIIQKDNFIKSKILDFRQKNMMIINE